VTLRVIPGRVAAAFRTRAAMGLRPIAAPVMLFIPLGVLLGPKALDLVSYEALAHLDIIISIALATLGVFIGIAAGREVQHSRRLLMAATLEAGITILVVMGALVFLLRTWALPLDMPIALAALALAVCASASAAPPAETGDTGVGQIAGRVADLDDVMPILLGGFVLALANPAGASPLVSATQTIGIGLAVGVGGWLLVERTGGAERAVFVLGTVALLGGAPAYLGMSPLLCGMAAGLLWVAAPGQSDAVIAHELRKVQHPIVVLLLLTAGATLEPTTAGVWLLAPYVVFRSAGKILGGWSASRIAAGTTPSDLGAYLIPPGVIGIAFALNLHQASPDAGVALVFAVAVGAIAAEALALVVTPAGRAR
jgi:hypothetical protein